MQDLVSEEGSLLYRLWQEEGGALYVCGQVAMARAVQVDRIDHNMITLHLGHSQTPYSGDLPRISW